MEIFKPQTAKQLGEALREAASGRKTIQLGGQFSKSRMGGPVAPAEVAVSTAALTRVLQYEPRDLTISVEAGLRYADLRALLAAQKQILPLDPPFAREATIGGSIAANLSGPRRRVYGTARDMVIGMKFATLEGKLADSGGMVVKNVAGLDVAKLLIGSFGTLAAIASLNFKLAPAPPCSSSFVLSFDTLGAAVAARDRILRGVLQPVAIDLLNHSAARTLGRDACLLALRACGHAAVMGRYRKELPEAEALEGSAEEALWARIEEFTPEFLGSRPEGCVVRVSAKLSQLGEVMASSPGPVVARAGNGICYGYFEDATAVAGWLEEARSRTWKPVVEFSPHNAKTALELWPRPGNDFELMQRIKKMFDPGGLLNRGRLYGRL